MTTLLAIVFTFLVFIRPQDWYEPLMTVPVVMIAGLFGGFFALFQPNVIKNKHLLLLFVFCCIGFISELLNFWLSGAIADFLKLLTTVLLPFLIMFGLAQKLSTKEMVFYTVIVAAMLAVFNGQGQLADPNGLGWANNPILNQHGELRIRYVGIFNDPNDTGLLLVMAIPLLFYFYQCGGAAKKFLALCAICYLVYGIGLTNSRGAILTLISMIGFYMWRRYGKIVAYMGVAAIVPVLLLLNTGGRGFSASEESAYSRLDAWYAGSVMLKSSPIFGVGLGNFLEHHHLTAHSTYVLCWSELGITGFIVWFTFLFSILFMLYKVGYNDSLELREEFKDDKQIVEQFTRYQIMSRTMLYSLLGFSVAVVFLSRLTFVPLYIVCAISLGTIFWLNQHSNYQIALDKKMFTNLAIMSFCVLIGINIGFRLLI
ncbi:O-antigen ligase family protein [Thalassotalea sp. LPB0316]|uniref:O-antigen ligase family protein n=1 Tax=Thalassotalea sp. LPB0316 TaxID=2769490 RepID=UPI00186717A3|nr:O-antigen ligase family protein [Thalassotalea sp. LPB0316]QOL26495.1 O-antigen ligase family protein [Thalassotalea sp. LPB0316]